jgi:hypothetical protein
MLAGCTGSLNTTRTLVVTGTPVAPCPGNRDSRVGGWVSTAVSL